MSMKPGATASPSASMIFCAPASLEFPCARERKGRGRIAAMRPSAMATSPATPVSRAVEQGPAADQDVIHRGKMADLPAAAQRPPEAGRVAIYDG